MADDAAPTPFAEAPCAFAVSVSRDERRALDHAFAQAYDELRKVAWVLLRSRSDGTLNPAALVNEAWMKLVRTPAVARTSRAHFKRIAARAMRQIVVESARRDGARKRGGTRAVLVPLTTSPEAFRVCADEPVPGDVEQALRQLEQRSARLASVVKSRFYAGLNLGEIAALLAVSESTILRDWRCAKRWLARELGPLD